MRTLPVLLIATFRPEFVPPWTGGEHVTALTLDRLDTHEVRVMVERLSGARMLPGELADQIVAKSDGVPLFVEELTRTVLEAGLFEKVAGRPTLVGPTPLLAIPATLRDSLTARLDRLQPVKVVAQAGAVLGREFPYDLLAAVSPLREDTLRSALARLAEAGLILPRGPPPGGDLRVQARLGA